MKSTRTKSPRTGPKKVLVVDDHPTTREGISQLIRDDAALTVAGTCGTAAEALAAVRRDAPDLVLSDLSMTERSGLELIKDLHSLYPNIPVLVFSMHYETLYAERALRAGARGYIMKSEGAERLLEAIRCVLRGNVYLSEVMRDRAVHRFARGPSSTHASNTDMLSDRELEVFELIGEALGTREIAGRLRVSTSTVETHRAHIKEKLNLDNATELVRAAVEWISRSRGG